MQANNNQDQQKSVAGNLHSHNEVTGTQETTTTEEPVVQKEFTRTQVPMTLEKK